MLLFFQKPKPYRSSRSWCLRHNRFRVRCHGNARAQAYGRKRIAHLVRVIAPVRGVAETECAEGVLAPALFRSLVAGGRHEGTGRGECGREERFSI